MSVAPGSSPPRPRAQRDTRLSALRNPAPGQPVTITNQMINALDTPAEAARAELQTAQDAAAAVPARIGLGEIAPDKVAWKPRSSRSPTPSGLEHPEFGGDSILPRCSCLGGSLSSTVPPPGGTTI